MRDGERSPLYEAHHAPRYERQELIRQYQNSYRCRLVVVSDILIPNSVTLFEEALYDADPAQDLHVILATPAKRHRGARGETARAAHRQNTEPRRNDFRGRCQELRLAGYGSRSRRPAVAGHLAAVDEIQGTG